MIHARPLPTAFPPPPRQGTRAGKDIVPVVEGMDTIHRKNPLKTLNLWGFPIELFYAMPSSVDNIQKNL